MMKKMFVAKTAFGAALLSAALAFTGCGAGGVAARTDTLIVGVVSMHTNLDPTLNNDIPSAQINMHVFDTLIDLGFDFIPSPNLATHWEWVDPANPTQLRVELRQGVLFHNGNPFSARDVQFSLERASTAPHVAAVAGMINHVQIINDYEVIIVLDYPFVPFINFLGHQGLSIVNEQTVTSMGVEAHSQAPVGTGPYRLTNIVAGDHVELTLWENHWGGYTGLETIIIRVLADASTRLIALETGEIDIMLGVPAFDHNHVMNHPELTLLRENSVATSFIAFDTSRPPFNDVRVRHAMNYALDIEAIVQTVFMGTQQRATGPIGGLVWGSAADRLPTFPHNPARAAELLAEAGFADGFAVTFFAPQGATVTIDTAEIVQNMLAPFGIQVSVQILEWGAFLEASNRGETDILSLAWVPTTGDPDQGLFATFHSSMHGAGGNRAFFTNAQVDALLEAGRVETDPVARAQIYYEIQQILREESPWIFFAQGIQALGIRNNVQGFRMSPNLINRFWGVSFS